jgi:hypothetical protein
MGKVLVRRRRVREVNSSEQEGPSTRSRRPGREPPQRGTRMRTSHCLHRPHQSGYHRRLVTRPRRSRVVSGLFVRGQSTRQAASRGPLESGHLGTRKAGESELMTIDAELSRLSCSMPAYATIGEKILEPAKRPIFAIWSKISRNAVDCSTPPYRTAPSIAELFVRFTLSRSTCCRRGSKLDWRREWDSNPR